MDVAAQADADLLEVPRPSQPRLPTPANQMEYPRFTLIRTCCNRDGVSSSLTQDNHGAGRSTAPLSNDGGRAGSAHCRALDHRQSSARVTNFARIGFYSM